jgi:hypothetical protein
LRITNGGAADQSRSPAEKVLLADRTGATLPMKRLTELDNMFTEYLLMDGY